MNVDRLENYAERRFIDFVKGDTQYRKIKTNFNNIKDERNRIVLKWVKYYYANPLIKNCLEYVYDNDYEEQNCLKVMSMLKDDKVILFQKQIVNNELYHKDQSAFVEYLKLHEIFHWIESKFNVEDILVDIKGINRIKKNKLIYSSEILADAFAISILKGGK